MPRTAKDFLVAPMNQADLLTELSRQQPAPGDLDAVRQGRIPSGLCWSLSLSWVYKKLQVNAKPAARVGELCQIDHVLTLSALQRQFFAAEIQVQELWVAPPSGQAVAARPRGMFSRETLTSDDIGERLEKTQRAATTMNLAFGADGHWEDLSGNWPTQEMKSLLESNEKAGILLGLRYLSGSGHAVACYKSHGSFVGGTHTYFYDPNDGEYVCKFSDTIEMLTALEQLEKQRNRLSGRIHWHVFTLADPSKRKK